MPDPNHEPGLLLTEPPESAPILPPQTSGYTVDITDVDQSITSHIGMFYTIEEAIAAADGYILDDSQIIRVCPVSYFRVA
jgi:hypothetical protein